MDSMAEEDKHTLREVLNLIIWTRFQLNVQKKFKEKFGKFDTARDYVQRYGNILKKK